MSDISLLERPGIHPNAISRLIYEKGPGRFSLSLPGAAHSLSSLPFDILLRIAENLDPEETIGVGSTCKTLREFVKSRAIWLNFAIGMLSSCQPLPLHGFQAIRDLRTPELIQLIRRGRRLNHSWANTDPKLIRPYKHVSAPKYVDIVWLSVITSKYTLCCTRTGRVLCWDIQRGECVATWASGADWEVWKCRVEFEEKVVYFAMAKRGETGFGADCQLMGLHFPGSEESNDCKPFFETISYFFFPGQVIGVYLLEPARRVLSAYIWMAATNQIGLYVLLDWAIPRYVFLNTGIPYEQTSREWSCIGYDPDNIVIHAEEETRIYQYFYPYRFLETLATNAPPSIRTANPPLIPPPKEVTEEIIPTVNPFSGTYITQSSHFVRQWWPMVPRSDRIRRRSCTILLQTITVQAPAPGDPAPGPNDPPPGTHLFTIAQHYFTIPPRKEHLRWWYIRDPFEIVCSPHTPNLEPPLPDEVAMVPFPPEMQEAADDWAVQAAVVVEHADAVNLHDVLDVFVPNDAPVFGPEPAPEGVDHASAEAEADDEPPLPVPPPPVPVGEAVAAELGDDMAVVPLVAVDFGCAVWLEYVSFGSEDLRVRYVTFPPVEEDRSAEDYEGMSRPRDIHTLEVPPEIDLKQVCHIGLDQAQGTIILGMRRSNVYVLRYE